MSFKYIQEAYGKEFKRGMTVTALGKLGRVTSATHYVKVRLLGEKHPKPYHPQDVMPVDY